MNLGEAAYLASPAALHDAYRPSSSGSRATAFSLILAAHVLVIVAVASIGAAVIQIVHPALIVSLIPEPPAPKPFEPVRTVPLPQLRKPEIVIPEPPRFEVIQAIQVVEKPAPAPVAPPPPSTPVVAGLAEPVVQPPRFDLAYLNNPAPSYPVFAKRAREQGKVMLRVQVDAEGKVAGIQVHKSSGSDRLDSAALAAVRQWRFVPARSGDKAIAGIALVPITFQLEG